MDLPAAVKKALEEEGWRVDWGAEALADALADLAGGPGGSGAPLTAADARGTLLDLDLRKASGHCCRKAAA
ncbi:hypothetical protein MNEG_14692, partial [Monoraphidium neglectum]